MTVTYIKKVAPWALFVFIYASYCLVIFEENKQVYCAQAPAEAATYCAQKF